MEYTHRQLIKILLPSFVMMVFSAIFDGMSLKISGFICSGFAGILLGLPVMKFAREEEKLETGFFITLAGSGYLIASAIVGIMRLV